MLVLADVLDVESVLADDEEVLSPDEELDEDEVELDEGDEPEVDEPERLSVL